MRKFVFVLALASLLWSLLQVQPAYALTARTVTWRVWMDTDRDGNKDGDEVWINQDFAKFSSTFDSSGYGGGVVVKEKWSYTGGYVYNSTQNSAAFVTVDVIVPSTSLCSYVGGVQSQAFVLFMPEGSGTYNFQFGVNYCV